jgi:hypothetical protein
VRHGGEVAQPEAMNRRARESIKSVGGGLFHGVTRSERQ